MIWHILEFKENIDFHGDLEIGNTVRNEYLIGLMVITDGLS